MITLRLSKNWPKSDTPLNLSNFELIYEEYRHRFYDLGQPFAYIPFNKLGEEALNKLESALLAVGFISSGGVYRYDPGPKRAAAYFYHINKSHFIDNGNKRASLAGLFGYLALNGKYLKSLWSNVYKLAYGIAKSKPKNKDILIENSRVFIEKYLVDYERIFVENFQISVVKWSVENIPNTRRL